MIISNWCSEYQQVQSSWLNLIYTMLIYHFRNWTIHQRDSYLYITTITSCHEATTKKRQLKKGHYREERQRDLGLDTYCILTRKLMMRLSHPRTYHILSDIRFAVSHASTSCPRSYHILRPDIRATYLPTPVSHLVEVLTNSNWEANDSDDGRCWTRIDQWPLLGDQWQRRWALTLTSSTTLN